MPSEELPLIQVFIFVFGVDVRMAGADTITVGVDDVRANEFDGADAGDISLLKIQFTNYEWETHKKSPYSCNTKLFNYKTNSG